ncbi:MAG: DUF6263 family protein [Planctomycetaceae bacterium]
MTRAFQPGLLLLIAAITATPAAADGPVLIRYKFGPKDKLIYRKTSDVQQTQKVNTMKVETTIKSEEILERRLDRIDGQKNFNLENENKRLKVSMKIGPLGKYKFDSTSDENEKGSQLGGALTPVYETLSGAVIKSTITPRGEVLAVKGFAELLAPLLKENPLAKQFVSGGTDKAARLQIAEVFPVFSEKKVKPGGTWDVPFEVELPKLGTAKGKKSYKYEGNEKLKGRMVAKITFTFELVFKLDLAQGGQKITGEMSISKSSGTVYFDVAKGQLVSLTGEYVLGGDLTVSVNGQDIDVRTDQTQKFGVELLDKLPE